MAYDRNYTVYIGVLTSVFPLLTFQHNSCLIYYLPIFYFHSFVVVSIVSKGFFSLLICVLLVETSAHGAR